MNFCASSNVIKEVMVILEGGLEIGSQHGTYSYCVAAA